MVGIVLAGGGIVLMIASITLQDLVGANLLSSVFLPGGLIIIGAGLFITLIEFSNEAYKKLKSKIGEKK